MSTEARDHFGNPLEHRFSRASISAMCAVPGLVNLHFLPRPFYWCVFGFEAHY